MIDEAEYKRRMSETGLSEAEVNRQWERRKLRHWDHEWHVAINRFNDTTTANFDDRRFMYEAKKAAGESERLALLFKREREGNLPKTFRKCSCCSEGKHIEDNHTFCCLGVECRKCEFLKGIEKAEMPPEQIDRAKAWTCVAHILSKGGDVANEGYVLTVDDRMFWNGVYESLASPTADENPH